MNWSFVHLTCKLSASKFENISHDFKPQVSVNISKTQDKA